MFELLAVPQRGTPYVQMGFGIVLYFLLIAPIFFLEFNAFVWISAPAVFF
jgi:hypothetical protein